MLLTLTKKLCVPFFWIAAMATTATEIQCETENHTIEHTHTEKTMISARNQIVKKRPTKMKTYEPNEKANRWKTEMHFINVMQFVSIEWSNFPTDTLNFFFVWARARHHFYVISMQSLSIVNVHYTYIHRLSLIEWM